MAQPGLTHSVLLVDGDAATRQALAEQLRLQGLAVVEAADGAAALRLAEAAAYDAAVIDALLPDGTGAALCARLRAAGLRCPLLLLTAGPSDEPAGEVAGPLARLAKPFRVEALLVRLQALLRPEPAAEGEADLGPYRFLPAAKLLVERAGGRRLRLTEKETAILRHLVRAGGAVVERERLLREVWRYRADVSTHTLETHIYRLRHKIEADPANPRLLLTEPGGYRLPIPPEDVGPGGAGPGGVGPGDAPAAAAR